MPRSSHVVSVIVCTRNRVGYLSRCLEALVAQDQPKDGYHIVVVDNGSTDSTPDRVREMAVTRAEPEISYVREERVGLSIARNTGLRYARGEVVAFIDDDAVPEPGWLGAFRSVLEQYPKAGCVGGPVKPIWEGERPPWLCSEMEPALSIFRPLQEVGRLTFPDYPRGVNCAFRRTALDAVGGFDPGLGRKGSQLLSNEEIELCARVERAGFEVVYAPSAAVRHVVRESLLSKRYFRSRLFWQGISDRVLDQKHRGWGFVARRRLEYSRRLPQHAVDGLRSRRKGQESRGFLIEIQCWYMVGYSGLLGPWKPF